LNTTGALTYFHAQTEAVGSKEFRRDAEDRGDWTPVQYYSGSVYASREAALAAAMQSVAWLPDAIRQSPSGQKLLPRTSN
jgi:hypothetical protein